MAKAVGGAETLFSRRALKYRTLGLDQKELLEQDLLRYMAEEYTFIRRPVVVAGKKATVGFNAKIYEQLFGP